MSREIRNKLIELARDKKTWSYSNLNEQLQLNLDFGNPYHRELIGEWLGDISVHEFERGRPLLSALIIHQGKDREQGDGFYKLCVELYGKNWEELKADPDFELERIKECYSFWKNNENFKAFKNDY